MDFDAVCVGACTVDWLVRLESFPEPDGRLPIEDFITSFGGMAATAAVALARLGAHVGFVGAVGDDDLGRAILDDLRAEGIDCATARPTPGARSTRSIVLSSIPSGLRSILVQPSTAAVPSVDHIALLARRGQHLHLDYTAFTVLTPDALARWRAEGVVVSVDAGTPIPNLPAYLAQIDVLVVPRGRLRALAVGTDSPVDADGDIERSVRAIQARGPRTVVVTLGERGCVGATGDRPLARMPAFTVDVMDTTGAGDVFNGALVYALRRYPDLGPALRFAGAAAALSCQAIGGRAACPTLTEVEIFLKAHREMGMEE